MLKNIPLSAKLVLILACPVLGFLWLASLYIANSYSTLKQMEDTVEASVAAQTVSRLITALQRERGASGVYLGSQGRTMANRLPGMRQATNEALSAVRELAAR
ncbi:MAG TPA: chemotaxis protein, partial [Pseudomonas sp.]|nr:chemotaxis protein [Pseudomonas sp.]